MYNRVEENTVQDTSKGNTMVQAQLKKQPRQEKESPDMSDKVIKALKANLSIPKSPSAEHMFVYKGWNAGGATRDHYHELFQ